MPVAMGRGITCDGLLRGQWLEVATELLLVHDQVALFILWTQDRAVGRWMAGAFQSEVRLPTAAGSRLLRLGRIGRPRTRLEAKNKTPQRTPRRTAHNRDPRLPNGYLAP